MNRKAGAVLGALLIVIGAVWVFQGLGYLGGSFMTGQPRWTWIGAATAAVGVLLALWAGSRRS